MDLLYILIPERCALCQREIVSDDHGLCSSCKNLHCDTTLLGSENRCIRCFTPLINGQCPFCNGRNVFLDSHVSLFPLNAPWHIVLKKWKFENQRSIYGLFLPFLLSAWRKREQDLPERIVYIDSGRALYSIRNYQPCKDLARGFIKLLHQDSVRTGGETDIEAARRAGFQLKPEALVRKKRKKKKQSALHRTDRFVQIHDSLELGGRNVHIAGQHILLIEDVFTTGATANEAARMLKLAGAGKVSLISVFFREVDGDHAQQISLSPEGEKIQLTAGYKRQAA